MDLRDNIITSTARIAQLLARTHTIAVVGMKTEAQSMQPAFYVPRYLISAGYEVIPVPVYYPDVTEILGRKVYRTLAEVPREIDLVNVFRRSRDVPGHLDDILRKRPRAVWMQLGIENDEVARKLAEAGIEVVQNRCIMVDHRQLARP